MSSDENVSCRPDYYNFSQYEPKDVIRSWGLNFNLGNVVKYIARAGRKGDKLEDLIKARHYLDFEIDALKIEYLNQSKSVRLYKSEQEMPNE